MTVKTGEFSGTDDFHFGHGTASIVEVEPGRYHLRLADFSVRNGPDLFVYLSPDADGYADDAIELGQAQGDRRIVRLRPARRASIRADFRSALIWCKQFSHLFAVAPFGGVTGYPESRGYTSTIRARTLRWQTPRKPSVART